MEFVDSELTALSFINLSSTLFNLVLPQVVRFLPKSFILAKFGASVTSLDEYHLVHFSFHRSLSLTITVFHSDSNSFVRILIR